MTAANPPARLDARTMTPAQFAEATRTRAWRTPPASPTAPADPDQTAAPISRAALQSRRAENSRDARCRFPLGLRK
jgi:hypothetical protein